MKKLNNFFKKPVVRWGIGGALGLGIGLLVFNNIELRNQNNDLFGRYSKTGNLYIDLVGRYNQIKRDTMKASTKHLFEIYALKKDNYILANKFDNLQKEYIEFAETSTENYLKLDFTQEKNDLLKMIFALTQENQLCKGYATYLDSLLLSHELDKPTGDKK